MSKPGPWESKAGKLERADATGDAQPLRARPADSQDLATDAAELEAGRTHPTGPWARNEAWWEAQEVLELSNSLNQGSEQLQRPSGGMRPGRQQAWVYLLLGVLN